MFIKLGTSCGLVIREAWFEVFFVNRLNLVFSELIDCIVRPYKSPTEIESNFLSFIGREPWTGPIKILLRKFETTLFVQAFCLDAKNFEPIKMLEK